MFLSSLSSFQQSHSNLGDSDDSLRAVSVATFRAAAAGFPLPITWQWQILDGSGVWTDIEDDDVYQGVTTPILRVNVTDPEQDGDQFRAVATNDFDSVETEAATLFVTTGSGILD